MKTLTIVLIFITIAACLASAQKEPAAAPAAKPKPQAQSEKPSAAQVMKLLDMLQIRDSLQITLDAMKAQMKNGSAEMVREKIPSPTPDQMKAINNIVDEAFAEISMDDMIRDIVPIYQKHLTRSDVSALIAFYSSPVGQKLRREQGAMMRESMEATSAGQRQKMEALLAKVEIRLQQLVEQSKQ